MFTKNNVSQSLVDAVKNIIGEASPIKEPTSTGMKVYGRSYGNSAKAKQDQTKSSVDDLKGPKTKDLMQKDKEEHEKTKGKYDEAAKPDYLDFDKDGDKKEPMKSALATKKKVAEELKGDQHKIDANKNNKVDAHDFAILRSKKKVKEDMYFAKKLIEGMKRSDIPAYVRKARGDAPLTPAEVKSGSKDSISDPKNLAKARNEEVEQIDEKNVPTSPEKWARAKAAAKSKFAVYPSAYANGWASKKYKAMGGGWKSVKEESEQVNEMDTYPHPDSKEGKALTKAFKSSAKKDPTDLNAPGKSPTVKQTTSALLPMLNKSFKKSMKKEEAEELDEASEQARDNKIKAKVYAAKLGSKFRRDNKIRKLGLGSNVDTAIGRKLMRGDPHDSVKAYASEEVELDEKQMTDDEMAKREKIVKSMKKGLAGFKSRYGKDAKSVMYATATKQAMKEGTEDSSAITTDTLIGRMPGGKSNDFKSYKIRVRPLDKEGEHQPKDSTPIAIQPDDTPARKSHETASSLKLKEGKRPETDDAPPFEQPYTRIPSNVKDKSGAVHTPMSRARDLAKAALKKVRTEMLGKLGTSES